MIKEENGHRERKGQVKEMGFLQDRMQIYRLKMKQVCLSFITNSIGKCRFWLQQLEMTSVSLTFSGNF